METAGESIENSSSNASTAFETSSCTRANKAYSKRGIFCREEISPVREYCQAARAGLDATEAASGVRGDRTAVLRLWKINGTWHWCSGRGFVDTGASITHVSRWEAAAAAEAQLKTLLGL